MPDTYVIHWTLACKRTGRTWDCQSFLLGDEAACAREIMRGDEFGAERVRRIDCYDAEEGWARLVSLEDMARAMARIAEAEQPGGGTITREVRDFIETHGSLALARGLIVADGLEHAA